MRTSCVLLAVQKEGNQANFPEGEILFTILLTFHFDLLYDFACNVRYFLSRCEIENCTRQDPSGRPCMSRWDNLVPHSPELNDSLSRWKPSFFKGFLWKTGVSAAEVCWVHCGLSDSPPCTCLARPSPAHLASPTVKEFSARGHDLSKHV